MNSFIGWASGAPEGLLGDPDTQWDLEALEIYEKARQGLSQTHSEEES